MRLSIDLHKYWQNQSAIDCATAVQRYALNTRGHVTIYMAPVRMMVNNKCDAAIKLIHMQTNSRDLELVGVRSIHPYPRPIGLRLMTKVTAMIVANDQHHHLEFSCSKTAILFNYVQKQSDTQTYLAIDRILNPHRLELQNKMSLLQYSE